MEGVLKISTGKPYGFIGDVFVYPSIITKYKLSHGTSLFADAIKTYNKEKAQWTLKVVSIK